MKIWECNNIGAKTLRVLLLENMDLVNELGK